MFLTGWVLETDVTCIRVQASDVHVYRKAQGLNKHPRTAEVLRNDTAGEFGALDDFCVFPVPLTCRMFARKKEAPYVHPKRQALTPKLVLLRGRTAKPKS